MSLKRSFLVVIMPEGITYSHPKGQREQNFRKISILSEMKHRQSLNIEIFTNILFTLALGVGVGDPLGHDNRQK